MMTRAMRVMTRKRRRTIVTFEINTDFKRGKIKYTHLTN